LATAGAWPRLSAQPSPPELARLALLGRGAGCLTQPVRGQGLIHARQAGTTTDSLLASQAAASSAEAKIAAGASPIIRLIWSLRSVELTTSATRSSGCEYCI